MPTSLAAYAFALLVVVAGAAHAAPPLKVAPIVYTQRHLANGLEVIAAENHASPTVAVQVWYHVGAKDDPAGRSGFAHLFEHLMFKSTRNLKDEQFDRLTEDVGGSNNAFTSDDVTAYHEVVPSNHLETLLWAEAERMSNLNVDEPVFKSERAVVEEEYRQRVLASPYGRFYNAISPSSYRVHPYRRSAIGSIEDLEAATVPDVVAFHQTYYRPDNATLVVTGDFDSGQLQAWVDKYSAPSRGRRRRCRACRSSSLHGPTIGRGGPWTEGAAAGRRAGLARPARQPRRRGGARGRGRGAVDRGFVAAAPVARLPAADRDRRAFQRRPPRRARAPFATAIGAGGKSIDDVRGALQTEIATLGRKPVSAAELAKAKTQLLTAALIERETPLGLGRALAEAAVIDGDAANANRRLDRLQAVTSADVQRVMRTWVAGPHHVAIEYTQDDAPSSAKPAGAAQ